MIWQRSNHNKLHLIILALFLFILGNPTVFAHTPEEKSFYLQSRIVLQLTPFDVTAGNVVGVWHLEYNELPQSEKAFETVLKKAPGHFLASAGLALIREHQGNDNQALKLVDEISKFPAGFSTFLSLIRGRVLFRQGQIKAAKSALLKGLPQAVNPHSHRIWLGRVFEKEEKFAQAEKEYRKAIEADPFWLEPYSRLSLLFNRQGRKKEALDMMSDIASLDNPSPYPNTDIQVMWRWAMSADNR